MSDHFDPVKYNGAMFLGLNGLAIKSHGSASPKAFANAIEVAYTLTQYDFNSQIERDLVASQSHLT
jgi:glycerol-3-phosphate acyltransferase PlsX